MTDEHDDEIIDVEALGPLERSPLEGPSVDGITALGELPEEQFEERLEALKRGRDRITRIKLELMVEDVHYGKIPGTDKLALLQPGAQLLCMIFGLRATFDQEIDYGDGQTAPAVRVRTLCYLHRGDTSGPVVATGRGAANTWERKHRYRRGERACPECGTIGSIIHGRKEFGGGFVCWKKLDGCGAKFEKTDRTILDQQVADVENEDQDDLENTVVKMSEKRAYIGATLRGTASSDLFTQDPEQPRDNNDRPDSHPANQGPVQQPQARDQGDGAPGPAPGDELLIDELHEARKLFPADVSKKITTSQQGRLYNLAAKNGWSNGAVDDEIARVLSSNIAQIPAVGDGYEAIVRWFQAHQPAASS